MTQEKISKLKTHLLMYTSFANTTYDKTTETALAITNELNPNAPLWTEEDIRQKQFFHRFGPEHAGVQEWAKTVIDQRFKDSVQVPHTKPIREFHKPVEPKYTSQERKQKAQEYGFRFDNFGMLLQKVGFWKKIGPLLEQLPVERGGIKKGTVDWDTIQFSLDDENYAALMNAINGSAQIDYESAFPELSESFDLIKMYKFHLDTSQIIHYKHKKKSPLSVPDILSTLVIDQANKEAGFDETKRNEINTLNALILDDTISNARRIKIYDKLQKLYSEVPETDFIKLVGATADELSIPEGRTGKISTLDTILLQAPQLDAVVPLGASDEGYNGYVARKIVSLYRKAAMIPSGGRAPHELLTGNIPKYTEADLMVAMALCNNLESVYQWKMPHVSLQTAPINQYDIFSPDSASHSTETNANETTLRLKALTQLKGTHEPLEVIIITNPLHSSRALIDFRNALKKANVFAHVSVYENKDSPHLTNLHTERKIHGLAYMFGEYVKHTYMVS